MWVGPSKAATSSVQWASAGGGTTSSGGSFGLAAGAGAGAGGVPAATWGSAAAGSAGFTGVALAEGLRLVGAAVGALMFVVSTVTPGLLRTMTCSGPGAGAWSSF